MGTILATLAGMPKDGLEKCVEMDNLDEAKTKNENKNKSKKQKRTTKGPGARAGPFVKVLVKAFVKVIRGFFCGPSSWAPLTQAV